MMQVQVEEKEQVKGRKQYQCLEEPKESKPKPTDKKDGKPARKRIYHTISARVEYIDAKTAERYLAKARKRRRVRRVKLENYVKQMLDGKWLICEPIEFNWYDELDNGGHRLEAVIGADKVKKGIKVPFLVTRGLDPKGVDVMDTGGVRGASTVLGEYNGVENATANASAFKILYNYVNRHPFNREVPPNYMLEMKNNGYAGVLDSVSYVECYRRQTDNRGIPVGALAAFHFLAERKDRNAADKFVRILLQQAWKGIGDPIRQLHILLCDRTLRGETRLSRTEYDIKLRLMFKAWNAWRKKKRGLELKAERREPIPELV